MAQAFGEKLKLIRHFHRWSLDEMAVILGSKKEVLSRYERGDRTPKITTAKHFADALQIPVDYLVDPSISIMVVDGDIKSSKLSGRYYTSEQIKHIEPPKTPEARILATGIDKMPKEQREAILNMMNGLYPGLFETEEVKNDT